MYLNSSFEIYVILYGFLKINKLLTVYPYNSILLYYCLLNTSNLLKTSLLSSTLSSLVVTVQLIIWMLLIIKLSHLNETDRKDLLNKNTGLHPGSQGQPGLRRDLYRELESREAGRQHPTPHLCLLLPICSILPSTSFLYFSVTYGCLEFTYYCSE